MQISRHALLAFSLLLSSTSYAATQTTVTAFSNQFTDAVLTAKSKSWRDPAFGDMGWTHSSGWGSFNAKKGQTVHIRLVAETAGFHPATTVWFRGNDDTAPNNYLVDHFYPQNANFTKFGATDETSGAAIGDVVMRHMIHRYDLDGNKQNVGSMRGLRDGVAGQLDFTFIAPRTGSYMFVVGGFNPNKGVDSTNKLNVNTTVTITAP